MTHFALEKTSREWEAVKEAGAKLEHGQQGGEEEVKEMWKGSLYGIGCGFGCELPVRRGLPCRHWMWPYYWSNQQLPPALFHSRYFYKQQSPGNPWNMEGEREEGAEERRGEHIDGMEDRLLCDRYRDHGRNMTYKAAMELVDFQKVLKGPMAEEFAQTLRETTEKLTSRVQELQASRQILPPTLPDAPKKPQIRHFSGKSKRRRGMTAREAAEAKERDEARKKRKLERQSELQAREKIAEAARLPQEATLEQELVDDPEEREEALPVASRSTSPYSQSCDKKANQDSPPRVSRSGRPIRKSALALENEETEEILADRRKPKTATRPRISRRMRQVSQLQDLVP